MLEIKRKPLFGNVYLSLVVILASAVSLSSCTREIDIVVDTTGGVARLKFRAPSGLFGVDDLAPCVIRVEVFEEATRDKIWSIQASSADCIVTRDIVVGSVPAGFEVIAAKGEVLSGRKYHASLVAEKGVGRSKTWRQP